MYWNNAHIRQGYLICIYLHRLPWQVSALGFVRVTPNPNPNHDIAVSYFVYLFKYISVMNEFGEMWDYDPDILNYLYINIFVHRIDIEWNIDLQLTYLSLGYLYSVYIEHDK